MEDLTKKLIEIKSVTQGLNEEQQLSESIFNFYKQLPAFLNAKEESSMPKSLRSDKGDILSIFPTENDILLRSSVLALARGSKNKGSNKTVILLGHLDTVDVEDYGNLKALANKPDELKEALKKIVKDPAVLKDLEDENFLFARGALDMKAGVAAQMNLFKYFLEHRDSFCGNLIVISECDEEGNSAGIFSALNQLLKLQKSENLEYIGCINSDYSTVKTGDEKRYLYVGSIGKLLPCFAVFGKEAHVGQVFSSLDPNLITAEITKRMCYSTALCDSRLGETTLPPVSLKQSDTKESYTVQTALCSFSYYNLFLYGMNVKEALKKCKDLAIEAMDAAILKIQENYKAWCSLSNENIELPTWKTRVLLWSEYKKELQEKNLLKPVEDFSKNLAQEKPDLDLRVYSLKIAEKARSLDTDKSPLVLIFPASTYYPRVEVSGKNEKEKALIKAMNNAAVKESLLYLLENKQSNKARLHEISVKMFYPYISDSSFLYACEEEGEEDILRDNMPAYDYRYTHPEKLIKSIDAPVVNIGTFGKDGHMFTERLEKRHSFEAMPRMILSVIEELLQ